MQPTHVYNVLNSICNRVLIHSESFEESTKNFQLVSVMDILVGETIASSVSARNKTVQSVANSVDGSAI